MKSKVIIPRTTFENIELIFSTLNANDSLTTETLTKITGLSSSTLSNTIPFLKEIGAIRQLGSTGKPLKLNPTWIELLEALSKDDKDKVKNYIKPILHKSKSLNEAYELVKNRDKISPNKLGHLIAKKFDLKWKDERSYGHVGRSLLVILIGFNLISSDIFQKKHSGYGKREMKKLLPSSSADSFFDKITTLSTTEARRLWLHNEDKIKIARIKAKLKPMINLGLAVINENDEFILTRSRGKALKKSLLANDESKTFREILLEYKPTSDVIRGLAELDKFSTDEIGDLIAEHNHTEFKIATKKWYGKNFLNWMKKGGFIEDNGEYGKFKIKKDIKNMLIKSTIIGNILDDPDYGVIKDIFYNSLIVYKKLPSEIERARIIDYIDHNINTKNGEVKLVFESIKQFIDYSYQYKDIQLFSEAGSLLVRVKVSEEVDK